MHLIARIIYEYINNNRDNNYPCIIYIYLCNTYIYIYYRYTYTYYYIFKLRHLCTIVYYIISNSI